MAYGLRYPNDTVMLLFPPIPMKVKYLVLALGIFTLLSGLGNASDGIAHFAHLGGMIFAYFLLKYWQKKRDQQNMYYH